MKDMGGVSGPFYAVMVVIPMDGDDGPTDWYEPVRNMKGSSQLFTDIKDAEIEFEYCKRFATDQKYVLVTVDLHWRQIK